MAIIEGEEPIVSRLDRLDHMLRHLEEMRGCNYNYHHNRASLSPTRSSCASTQSSGTLNSEGGPITTTTSSVEDWSPRSMEKYCRPIGMVMMETQVKGNLIDRLVQVEDRLLKLCMQVEQQEGAIKSTPTKSSHDDQGDDDHEKHHHHKKGLKQLVKSCVRAGKGGSKSTSPGTKTKKHHWI